VKFQSLSLRNFMAHRGTDVGGPTPDAPLLKPVVVLLGDNAQGKTSILRAVEVLRFGNSPGVLSKESGAYGHNGERWKIKGAVEYGDNHAAVVTRTASNCDHSTSDLNRIFGDPRVFRAVLNCQGFSMMKPEQRKELVGDLSSSGTGELVEQLVTNAVPDDIIDAVREGNMKKAHRLAQEGRRRVARAIREFEAAEGAAVPDVDVEIKGGETVKVSTLDPERIVTGITRFREKLSALRAQVHAYEGNRKTVLRAKDAEDELASILNDPKRPSWDDDDAAALAHTERQIKALDKKIAAEEATADSNARGVDVLRRTLEHEGGECPSCGTEIGADQAERIQGKVKALLGRQEGAKEQAESYRHDRQLVQVKERDLLNMRSRARQADGRLSDLRARVSLAEGMDLEAEHPDPNDEKRLQLEAALERVLGAKAARDAYDAARERTEGASDRKARAQTRWDVYAMAEAACDPQAADTEEAIEKLNRICAKLGPDLGVSVRVTDGWQLRIGSGIAWPLASRSERERAGFVLSVALVLLSGVRWLCLDDLEHMSDTVRPKLLKLVRKLTDKGHLDQVMLAQVTTKRPERAPDWLSMFWIENGEAHPVA
jgi:hypothetical protein